MKNRKLFLDTRLLLVIVLLAAEREDHPTINILLLEVVDWSL